MDKPPAVLVGGALPSDFVLSVRTCKLLPIAKGGEMNGKEHWQGSPQWCGP